MYISKPMPMLIAFEISIATIDIMEAIKPKAAPRKNMGRATRGKNMVFQLGMTLNAVKTPILSSNDMMKLATCWAVCLNRSASCG